MPADARPRSARRRRLQSRSGHGRPAGATASSGRARRGSSTPSSSSAARARSPPAARPGWDCARRWPASSATTSSAGSCSPSCGARRRHRAERRRPDRADGDLGRAGRAGRQGDADVPGHDRRASGRRWSPDDSAPAGPSRPHRRLVPAGRRAGAARHPAARAGGGGDDVARSGRRPRRTVGRRPAGRAARIDHLLPNAAEALRARPGSRTSPRRPARSPRPAPGDRRRQVRHRGRAGRGGRRARGAPRPWRSTSCDTIGAGDSTNAGWLAGVLNGWPADRCAALAAACGSLSTRARGGTRGPARPREAIAAL